MQSKQTRVYLNQAETRVFRWLKPMQDKWQHPCILSCNILMYWPKTVGIGGCMLLIETYGGSKEDAFLQLYPKLKIRVWLNKNKNITSTSRDNVKTVQTSGTFRSTLSGSNSTICSFSATNKHKEEACCVIGWYKHANVTMKTEICKQGRNNQDFEQHILFRCGIALMTLSGSLWM